MRNKNIGSLFGNDSSELFIDIEFQTSSRLRVKITNGKPRYQVPIEIPAYNGIQHDDLTTLYDVKTNNNDPFFSIQIIRKATGKVLIDTNIPGLIFSDQFLQIPMTLASENVYGLGEIYSLSLKHDLNWVRRNGWARDANPGGTINNYGVQPILTILENDGNAHTIMFMNSNAQEWAFMPNPAFIYRTTGGILDFYVFLGPSPDETYQQLTEAIGRFPIPPYWTLGFHLCRYGYKNTTDIELAYNRTAHYKIPQDGQWADIDIMHKYLDFTVDDIKFKGLPNFVDNIHKHGRKFVTILDPGIDSVNKDSDGTYLPFNLGQQMDVWVKEKDNITPVTAKVWPYGPVHFPDFFKNSTYTWWKTCISLLHSKLKVDGLWTDMNEPSNFGNGDIKKGCEKNHINNPPYIAPTLLGGELYSKTICPDSHHVVNGVITKHYDVHSMYGWSQHRATLDGIREVTKGRGFILTRSSFIGSGKWASKWLGDTHATWDDLKYSIIGIITFNMFGIPHIGADICGFGTPTTPELCARWSQVGAFYPFARNHNDIYSPDQDPGVFGPRIAGIIRDAFRYRYNFLPILYTLYYQHEVTGSTVARAMWNVFPRDNETWNINEQFMWGSQIMVSPVLDSGKDHKMTYFPQDSRWYEVTYFLKKGLVKEMLEERGNWANISAPLEYVPIFFKGGNVFFMQQDDLDTTKSRLKPFDFEVALNDNLEANGTLFYDDGITLDTIKNKQYFLAEYSMKSNGIFQSKIFMNNYQPIEKIHLQYFGVMGLKNKTINSVIVNNKVIENGKIHYDNGRLQVVDLSIPMNEELTIKIQ